MRVSGKKRDYFRFIGSLAECRAAYDKYTGHAHEWSDIEATPSGSNVPPGCYVGLDGVLRETATDEEII